MRARIQKVCFEEVLRFHDRVRLFIRANGLTAPHGGAPMGHISMVAWFHRYRICHGKNGRIVIQ